MGLVVSSTAAYATVQDVRDFGVADTVTDEQIADAIEVASEMIDGYTGSSFGLPAVSDYIVNDVRKALVPLPTPFSDITDVKINGFSVNPTQWTLDTWGIRLSPVGYYDPDGFPYPALTFSGVQAIDLSGPYGVQVTVTGTFGYQTVPARVRQACKMLAARLAVSTASDALPDSRVKGLAVEGYSVRYDDTNVSLDTTGDLAVDRLLSRYRSVDGMVG